jgi:hypothetical protein
MHDVKYFPFSLELNPVYSYLRRPNLKTMGMAMGNAGRRNLKKIK